MRSGDETNTVHTVKQKVFLFKTNCSSSFHIKKIVYTKILQGHVLSFHHSLSML